MKISAPKSLSTTDLFSSGVWSRKEKKIADDDLDDEDTSIAATYIAAFPRA